jgi:hypothetical protein
MNTLGQWLTEQVLKEQKEITKVIAIFPGRFQPMGRHHAKAFKWVQGQGFDEAWVATSGKVEIPKSPFSFKEKEKIIKSYGIGNVKQVKNPYKAEEILSKYPEETTAAVFVVGDKDAKRLGGKFFRPWKGKAEVGYRDGAYTLAAPDSELNVPGYGEMSGTNIRKSLGQPLPKKDDFEVISDYEKALKTAVKEKQKLFKGIFGHTKNYDMVVKKLLKLNEIMEDFISKIDLKKIIAEASNTAGPAAGMVDDGPTTVFASFKGYESKGNFFANQLGWKVVDYILSNAPENKIKPDREVHSVTYFPAGEAGALTPINRDDLKGSKAWKKYVKRITQVALRMGYEFVNFLGAEASEHESKKEPNKPDKEIKKVAKLIDKQRKKVNEQALTKEWWEDIIKKKIINEEYDTVIQIGGGTTLKYNVSDVPGIDEGVVAKRYDFEFYITHPDATLLVDKTIKDSIVMAFGDKSPGLFSIGKDIEKFTGLKLKDAQAAKETPTDAYVFGLVNAMNGGGELFFFNNGPRLAGNAAEAGSSVMMAVMEQLQHEAGIHATHQLLVREVARQLGVDTTNDDWITYDYGGGEYMWPAIGDIDDKKNPIVMIDGESFAMFSGMLCQMLMPDFFDMASKYIPSLKNLNLKEIKQLKEDITLPVNIGDTVLFGKFKNKKVVVKTIGWNEKGDLLINGKSAMRMRLLPKPNIFDEAKQSRLAHGNLGRKYKFQGKPEKLKTVRKGQRVVYTGEQNPDDKFEGKTGTIKRRIDNRHVAVEIDGMKGLYQMHKNDLAVIKEGVNEGLITEGGAYGHMEHPFDDRGLTFGDFKNIIELSLQGQLDLESKASEKTDGQNLFITWSGNKLKAARNTGDIKKGGVDASAIAKKFAGRGNIEKAFNYAMRDLGKAIGSLKDKQKVKIFDDGNNWVNMEIMYPASANVIVYDAPYLQFHNVLKYQNGTAIGSVPDGARILSGMITQVNQNVQKSFSVIGPQILKVKPHQDFAQRKGYFNSKLNKLMSSLGMKDSNKFAEYHQAWWERFVDKTFPGIDNTIKMGLVKRWAFNDKSFRLNGKTVPDKDLLDKIKKEDKVNVVSQVKKNMLPFETLFFELGAEVLKNAEGFLAANPDKAVQAIRKQVASAIKDVRKGGDLKKLNKVKDQLAKIQSIGGFDSIVPSEGLVFIYKGNTYKLTGAFAPVNQITGLMTF